MKLTVCSRIILVGLSLCASSLPAQLGDSSKLPPPAKTKGLTYAKDILPVLETSCLNCHGPDRPKSKYRMDSREAMIRGGSSEKAAVVPGDSAQSPIVHYAADLVAEMEMPPLDKRDKYSKLTPEQIGIIRAWIDQGAK